MVKQGPKHGVVCLMSDEKMNNLHVPYIVYEGAMVRMERTIRRLFILLIVLVAIVFATNAIWLYWWNQYDYVTETETYSYQQDGSGLNLIGDRNHINGSEIYEEENEENSY